MVQLQRPQNPAGRGPSRKASRNCQPRILQPHLEGGTLDRLPDEIRIGQHRTLLVAEQLLRLAAIE
ncbi:MAG: hypothetical protein ACKPKO_64155, partial [Candidatus Fonsibacter sp.]